jgi:hypothetical protein
VSSDVFSRVQTVAVFAGATRRVTLLRVDFTLLCECESVSVRRKERVAQFVVCFTTCRGCRRPAAFVCRNDGWC